MKGRLPGLCAWLLAGAAGCGVEAPAPPPAPPPAVPPAVRVIASANGPVTQLTLLAAPHLRVNARLAPALELRGGVTLRFDGPRTPDSAYFAAPPTADLPRGAAPHGRLRASVCDADEQVCRSLVLDL